MCVCVLSLVFLALSIVLFGDWPFDDRDWCFSIPVAWQRRLLRRKQLLQEEEERRIRLAQIKAHRKERQAELMESSKWSHILSSRTTSRSRSRSPSRRGPSRRRSAGDGLPSSAHNTHDFLDRMENFEVVDPSVVSADVWRSFCGVVQFACALCSVLMVAFFRGNCAATTATGLPRRRERV